MGLALDLEERSAFGSHRRAQELGLPDVRARKKKMENGSREAFAEKPLYCVLPCLIDETSSWIPIISLYLITPQESIIAFLDDGFIFWGEYQT